LETWLNRDGWWDNLTGLVDWKSVVAGIRMSHCLRHVWMVWIVENVESGRDWLCRVPTDRADVLCLGDVRVKPFCSIDRFAYGYVGGRQIDHPGDATVGLGVDPASIPLCGGDRETAPDGDVLWYVLEDDCRPTLGERPSQAGQVIYLGVGESIEGLVTRFTQRLVDTLGDETEDGEISVVSVGTERLN
jgi:hypothetical protein